MADTYQFGESYQCKVAALLLRDPVFIPNYGDSVSPAYFDYSYLQTISRIGLDFYKKWGRVPSKDSLVEDFQAFCQSFKVAEADRDQLLRTIDWIYQVDLSDSEAIMDRVLHFGKRQALRQATLGVIDLLSNPNADVDEAESMVRRALAVGSGAQNLGMDLIGNLVNLPAMALGQDGYNPDQKIMTGLPSLDKFTRGGPAVGQVCLVMGPSGAGKSTWLVNIGAVASKLGKRVLHVTIADLNEVDTGLRYACRLTGCTLEEVLSKSKLYMSRAEATSRFNHYFKIKQYPAGGCDINTLRSLVSQVENRDGVKVDMLIVDYPGKMKGASNSEGSGYAGMGRIYDGLNMLSNDFKLLTWGASQVQRWVGKDENKVITQDNLQDSKLPGDNSDMVLSFNQAPAEKATKPEIARVWVDKVRRGQDKEIIYVSVDRDRMMIREIPNPNPKK
jgi:replicative DNA helicase